MPFNIPHPLVSPTLQSIMINLTTLQITKLWPKVNTPWIVLLSYDQECSIFVTFDMHSMKFCPVFWLTTYIYHHMKKMLIYAITSPLLLIYWSLLNNFIQNAIGHPYIVEKKNKNVLMLFGHSSLNVFLVIFLFLFLFYLTLIFSFLIAYLV